MADLAGIPWGALTPMSALVVSLLWFGRALGTGLLVQRWLYEQVIADRDRERERADTLAATIPTLVAAVTGLTEGQETQIEALGALKAEVQARAACQLDDDLPPTHTRLGGAR